jgi:uncharacterized protein YgiM (DUF1202 family)
VYEARIQELERQLARVKHQRDKVLKLTDEDSEVKDFMSKEMQVELEHQQVRAWVLDKYRKERLDMSGLERGVGEGYVSDGLTVYVVQSCADRDPRSHYQGSGGAAQQAQTGAAAAGPAHTTGTPSRTCARPCAPTVLAPERADPGTQKHIQASPHPYPCCLYDG